MAYRVRLTLRAQRDLDLLYEAIEAEHTNAAFEWYLTLKRAILSLEENPLRCPATLEDQNLRHLLFGKKPHVYRVIYRVGQKPQIGMYYTFGMALGTACGPGDSSRGETRLFVR